MSRQGEEPNTRRICNVLVPDLNLTPNESESNINAREVKVYTRRICTRQKLNAREEKNTQVSDMNTCQKLNAEEVNVHQSFISPQHEVKVYTRRRKLGKITQVSDRNTHQRLNAEEVQNVEEGGYENVHGDRRLDVVNMSYEELRAEAQQTGIVSTGLSEEFQKQPMA